MVREFLGVGWKYPLQLDRQGRIAVSAYEDDIAEAIRIILGTAKGERVMRPEYGCDIRQYVFAPLTATNLRLIEHSVWDALTRWEPRIDVHEVRADAASIEKGELLIHVDYTVRAYNTRFNKVYPFYLREG